MNNHRIVHGIMRLVKYILLGGTLSSSFAATTDGPLKMEVITAYNFVVDSNIESPAGKSPSAAHLGVKIFNDGPTALTNVVVNIGKLTTPATSTGTPGTFESRTVDVPGQYAGNFALQMPGGEPDAVRIIPRIEAGQSVVQYFFVTYPLKDSLGRSVTGSAPDPSDDLWLNYDIWAYATDGANTRRVDKTTRVTMRNEISAMANKIWPNGSNKVPDQYLSVIESFLGWRPSTSSPRIPGASLSEGIWYDLGTVGAGFDNNGDGIPDRNAWLQPVGNPTIFSPLAARMVKCYGIVIVKLNDGTEKLIPFEDRLYFENIPANNTGAVGLVYYEFLPLNTSLPSNLSPYQEVASGYDNEKFNADYGTVTGIAVDTSPSATIVKTGPATRLIGQSTDYTLTATNTGTVTFGWPNLGLPVVIEDPVPSALQFVAGSAVSGPNVTNPAGGIFTVYYSTNNGATWVTTEPTPASSVNRLRWVLDRALAPGDTATVKFSGTVASGFTGSNFSNTGILKTGTETEVTRSTWPTVVSGINSVGDFIWRDLNRDGVQNGGLETGIANIGVSLYVDVNGDSLKDAGDTLYGTTSTDVNGAYLFSNLPDRKYIVVVDSLDPDVPTGFTLKQGVSANIAVDLDSTSASSSPVNVLTADWPFIKALEVTKSVSPTTYLGGQLINYTIDLDNHMSTLQPSLSSVQTSYVTSTAFDKTNASAKATESQAAGAPNSLFTFIDWQANSDRLATTGVSPAFTQNGTITKVEIIIRGNMSRALDNDQLNIEIGHVNRVIGSNPLILTTAQMNALVGVPQNLVVDITSASAGWTLAQVNSLTAALTANKTSAGDVGDYYVDSIGFRVTTNNALVVGTAGPNTISDWPLKDTYDPTKLEYVTASVLPNATTPLGTLEWNNLGPVNPGTRKTITVTFRAKTPTDTNADGRRDPMLANNYVTTLGNSLGIVPLFSSGLTAGHDDGTVDVTINPSGRIGDFVYWDVDGNGSYGAGDSPLSGVIVQLFQGGIYTGRSQTTNAAGFYEFAGLADGTYEVRIVTTSTLDLFTLPWTSFTSTQRGVAGTQQTGYVVGDSVVINNSDLITTNDTNFLQDFGFDSNVASTISGKLFRDWNGNGIQDPGDEPLVGYTVTLDGGTPRSVITDSNGFYQFTNLTTAGNRTVAVTAPPAAHTQTLDPDTTFDSATTINLALGVIYANRDFAYRPTGTLTIGDTLYYDWNGNGIQDAGEPGIANVDIRLYEDANGDGIINAEDALISTQTTNASGFYQFSTLASGNYIVEVVHNDPDFPVNSSQTQGYNGALDDKAKVNLTASLNTVDFGYKPLGTASIGNLVWLDANNNGLKDTSETGIDGVTVHLFRSGTTPGVDTPVASTTTTGGGFYSFTSLPTGGYYVYLPVSNFGSGQALQSYPWSSTTTSTGDNQINNDDNGIQSGLAAAVVSPLITLSAAESDQTIDFGFTGTGSIGDLVFYDFNGNGNLDFTETGINGVTVELYLDANGDNIADGPFIATAVTATVSGVSGYYLFSDLPPNTYIVKVRTSTLPAGVTQTADPDLDGISVNNTDTDPNNDGDNADVRIILYSGSNYTGADFGYQPPGATGDFVWLDLNKNGLQDSGEPGIANVEIQISGDSTYSVFTDPDGYWSTSVPDGNWTATVLSSNFDPSAPLENRVQTYDADGTGTANATSIVVSGGVVTTPAGLAQGNLGIDFGYSIDGNYGIAGTVLTNDTRTLGTADDFDDFFDDGTDMDAGPLDETELQGILVYLYSGSTLLGTTTTDAYGNYSFPGLPNGTYNVIIGTTAPPLNTATLTTTAANNPAVSVVNSSSGTSVIQTVTITDAFVNDVDFAFISNVSYDFGDLPLSYTMTTLGQDGARHTIPSGGSTLYLGTAPDAESTGISNSQALGDDLVGSDDEDGVIPNNINTWVDGASGGSLQVSVTGSGWLVGWVDWNHDGDFLDPGEMIVTQAVSAGSAVIAFDIPLGTVGVDSESWLSRFRIFTTKPAFPLFSYTGVTTDGEVEDYLLEKPVDGSIGDLVWNDANGDSLLDSGEVGIGGLTVELRDGSNTLIDTQITSDGTTDVDGDGVIDPAGYYRFRGLGADDYTVTVATPPTGFTPSYDGDGIATVNSSTVTLASGIQNLSADFGYAPLLSDISGQVRYDADSDGDLGDADAGAIGVRIQLWTDPNGDGDPADGVQVGEAFTDSSGNYLFADVPSGNYVVVEINPSGSTSTADVDGGNPDRIAVVLTGTDVTGRDFLDSLPPVYQVSGSVYDDNDTTDDNVIGADDQPIAGVTVSIYIDRDLNGLVNSGDTLLNTNVTDGSGAYSFSGLLAGSYVIVETDPSLVTSEWDAQGNPTDNQIGVTITNADVTSLDFLDDSLLGTVSGHLYFDIDGNGTQDAGEPNLANVDVIVTDSNAVTQTVSTNSSGNWTATVPPGTTSADVDETDPQYPTGYAQTDGEDPTEVTVVGNTDTFAGNDGYFLDLDTDDDGIPDTVEIDNVCPSRGGDTDGDGVPDFLDLDSDGDGIFDVVEAGHAGLDADNDGQIDSPQGTNGLADIVETAADSGVINYTPRNSDLDDRPDYLDLDSDNDSISDVLESGNLAVSDVPVNVPLIGVIPDGIADGTVNVDGIVPGAGATLPVNSDADSLPNYIDVDSDADNNDNLVFGLSFDIVNNGYGSLDVNLDGMIDNVSSLNDCDGIADVLDPRDDEYGWFPVAGCAAWSLGAAADIDSDVFPTDQEYAFGGDTELGGHRVAGTTRRAGMTIEKNGTVVVLGGDPGGVNISFVRPRGRYDVTYTLYVSDDPRDNLNWTAVTALPVITDNGDNTETLKWISVHDIDGNAAVTRDRGFARLNVSSPCRPEGSWTLVQGWQRQNVVGKYQTYGVNFTSMPVFTGMVDAAELSAIFTVDSSKGQDLGSFLTPGNAYYLELTDGPHEGHRFDIVSGDVGTFVLDLASVNNTTNSLSSDMAGSHFVVRKHDTLGGIYLNAEWAKSVSPGSADQVLLYNGTGYDTYFNLALGSVWAKQGNGFGSKNSTVVAPGTGMMVVHAFPNGNNELLAIGDLRYNDFRRPLKLGSNGLNFVAMGYPFSESPGSLNMTETNGFTTALTPGVSTQILNWNGDTAMNSTGWTTNFQISDGQWNRQGNLSESTTDSPLLRYSRGTHVDVQADKLDWKHPMPWDQSLWIQPGKE